MFRDKIIIAGAGGQGALRIGQMIAYASLDEGYEVTWLPSYGAEMRGGTANCNVIISDAEIPFASVSDPQYCIVMNDLSLLRFSDAVNSGGILLIDSNMVKADITRKDITVYRIPADRIAEEEGNPRGMNMVMLGAFLAATGRIPLQAVYAVVDRSFTGSKAKYADSNKRLVNRGFDYIRQQQGSGC